jgi:hypothetical protein
MYIHMYIVVLLMDLADCALGLHWESLMCIRP